MFKIDKKTHLIILFTFAMVFVVVYLYYTIQDLRKTQVELKRVQDELATVKSLTSAVSNMKADVDELKNVKHIKANIDINKMNVAAATPVEKVSVAVADAPPAAVGGAPLEVHEVHEADDDTSSVDTEEIRDMLDGGMDDGDADIEIPAPVDAPAPALEEEEAPVEEKPTLTPEQLKNLKVDELKDLCRDYNLSTKGNKNELLVRIFDHLGMN